MAEINDTTSKTISGKLATADLTLAIGADVIHYKCILDTMRVREVTPMDAATVFCTEGTSSQDPGTSTLLYEIGGVGKYDGPASGPLIPAPQNVPMVQTYHTGCTFTFVANFTEASFDKVAGQNARMGGRGLNNGAYVVVWDKTPGP
jgi:hypothetical protein